MSLSSTVFDIVGVSQKLDYTSTSSSITTDLPSGTEAVRLRPTTDCYFAIGTSPVSAATATSHFMAAYEVEYFAAKAGQKVAVIRDTTGGTMHVTPVAKN
jgi:hypothetical protein